jgi:hypothetical protein
MQQSGPIRHLSLFTLYENTDSATRQKALELLRSLGEDSENVLEWRVEVSLATRKGYIIAESALFRDAEALEKWRVSEKHQQVVSFMKDVSDWVVADYLD